MWVIGWMGCADPVASVRLSPRATPTPPTENLLSEGDEEAHHEQRREAEAHRHRAAPGTDWRQRERDNAERAIARANERRRSGAPAVGTWLERGSDNLAGSSWWVERTPDHVYSGSDLGGLWRADRTGADRSGVEGWTPVGDVLYGGVHHLAVLPATATAPEVLFTSPDAGPFFHRSEDGGATWTVPDGLGEVWSVRTVAAATDGSHRLFVLGNVGDDARLFVSTDRGRTFRRAHDVVGAGAAWVDRVGGSRVLVAGTDRLWTSPDGVDFSPIPLPRAFDEVRLAASEATEPPTVFVAGRTGETWELLRWDGTFTPLGAVDDFWWAFTASTRDPAVVAFGGVDLHVSRDAGTTFASPNTWDEYYADPATKLHADIMAISAVSDDDGGETWYVGSHGGAYRSRDGLTTVENLSLSGLRIGQYYGSLTDWSDPDRVLVGSQDQGLQSGRLDRGASPPWGNFVQEVSGDYGHLVSADGTHARVAAVYPGIVLVRLGGPDGTGVSLYFDFPPGDGAPWLPVLVADPHGRDAFFFLGRRLWRYAPEGEFDYRATEWSDTDFGLSGDWEMLTGLAFDPFDPSRAWAVTSDGRVFRSENDAKRFRETDDGLPLGNWYYGSALVVSRRRVPAQAVYVGGSGYDGPAVFRSLDAGRTFAPWSEGLPPTMVNTLVELRDGTGRLLAGAETGVWMRGPDDPAWVDVSSGHAPITNYWSAELLPDENTVRFSTYGRGLWDLRLADQDCVPTRDDDGDGAPCDLDCDDGDPGFGPSVVDADCDGVDHDCDGSEERDGDADGHGACDDCDDDDGARFPGATDDTCDGVDQDCDGRDWCQSLRGGACGCAAPSGAGPAWLGALGATVAAVRRRRLRPVDTRARGG